MRRLQPAFLLLLLSCGPVRSIQDAPVAENAKTAYRLSVQDELFLEDLSCRSFQYFWEQSDPGTGLTLDRARADGSAHDEHHRAVGSIAATGFGLTGLCIASERRWLPAGQACQRVRATLRFLADIAPHQKGWFYHWMDLATGERRWQSEISSIDTALLLGGVLTCRQFYAKDQEIVDLATRIYERIDFPWMLAGHPTLLSHGWKPETGFIPHRWDNYSEHTILYLLAIGSPGQSITERSWYAWERDLNVYREQTFIGRAPLFTHQYSQAWVDYRGRRENRKSRLDYFANSVAATRAHRCFCLDLRERFSSYSENLWGITASDSPYGYVAWGGPPAQGPIDGTLVPCAAAGSLMFTPDICLPVLKTMRQKYGRQTYGRYGFVDAFNPLIDWVGPDVVGIDLGITLLSAENLRTGRVWRWFMQNREVQAALEKVGLRPAPISRDRDKVTG